MPNVFQGDRSGGSGRFAVVVSRYNDSITGKLLNGAVATLTAAGVADASIDVAWVPGAWEIPLAARRFAESGDYCAVLCLGAVIKGETSHDQHINRQVSLSLGQIALKTGVPVLFGVLTCNSIEQAIHRSGGNVGNKGVECAEAALEMASLLSKLPAPPPRGPDPFDQAERGMAAAPEALGTPSPALRAFRRTRQVCEEMGRAPSENGETPVESAVAEVPVPIFSRPRPLRRTRRSRARQVVLQVLYADDLNPGHDLLAGRRFLQQRLQDDRELVAFARGLVVGIRSHRAELDRILTDKLKNWTLDRLAVADRNVLRMGIYEILFGGTPGPVAINEAVELARRFGSKESTKFVNGVLDRVLREPTRGN
jgi:6,7-dimethyl-8-ribityllumazine synthase